METLVDVQCFTPVQVAKFITEAHPFPVDIFAIMKYASVCFTLSTSFLLLLSSLQAVQTPSMRAENTQQPF